MQMLCDFDPFAGYTHVNSMSLVFIAEPLESQYGSHAKC